MSSNIVNQTAFLRTAKEFPEDVHQLSFEVNRTYVDIANAVNNRTIGIYPANRPAVTGNSFFQTTTRKQTFRQIYVVSVADIAAGFINHNIKNVFAGQFINCFGSYTDGTNTFGLFFASSVPIAGQTTFYVTSTQIILRVGAGAPVLTSGIIVLEWITSGGAQI
jgi:hypothetical protein